MALVRVEFDWSDEYGKCYKCGYPAQFFADDPCEKTSTGDTRKRCAICAAHAAVLGERITRIDGMFS